MDVIYEPDGNVPPDFLVNGRIAVEVRRLNQNEETAEGPRGLEEVAVPLQARVTQLLSALGPAEDGESWYVTYDFRRPLADERLDALRSALTAFRDAPPQGRRPGRLAIAPRFKANLLRAGRPYTDFFVFGGYADGDSGGFVLAELSKNIRICIEDKSKKVARVRGNYPEWWLLLVDHIALGFGDDEGETLRQLMQFEHDWDKIVIVSPLDPSKGYEL